MYKEIENILVRTISPFEYEQLEDLKQKYSEEQIINAYKTSSVKNINYIKKVLQSKIKNFPSWIHKEIKEQPIDEETQQEFDNFNKFIEEFRK